MQQRLWWQGGGRVVVGQGRAEQGRAVQGGAGQGAYPRQGIDVLPVIADAAAVDVEAEQDFGGRVVQSEHDLHGRLADIEPSAKVDDEARAVDVPRLAVACKRVEDAPREPTGKELPLVGAAGARKHEDVHVGVGGRQRALLQQRAEDGAAGDEPAAGARAAHLSQPREHVAVPRVETFKEVRLCRHNRPLAHRARAAEGLGVVLEEHRVVAGRRLAHEALGGGEELDQALHQAWARLERPGDACVRPWQARPGRARAERQALPAWSKAAEPAL